MLRAKGSTKNAAVPLPGFEAQFHAAKPEGQALPRAVRDYFEPRMGFDFGQVKIHAGNQARRLNEAVMARAFTCGSHVFLDADAVEFSSASGRRLLAHELTHVMQQDGVGGSLIQRQPAPANDEFASKGPVAKAREDVGNALLIASRKLDQAIKNRDNNSILPPDVFGAYRRFFGESDLEKLEKLEVLKVRIDEAAGWIATMPFDIIPNPVPAGYRDEAIHRLALAGGAQHATAMQPPLSGGDMYIAIYPPWYADASMRAPKVLHELFHFFPDVRHAVAPARTEPPWQNARAYQGFVGTLAGLTEGAQLGGMFPP